MNPAYWAIFGNRRPRGPAGASTGGTARTGVTSSVTRSGAEHLVEGVDVGLLVAGGALDRHLQRVLRHVVRLTARAIPVTRVDEDLVRLFVEERAPVRDEVLRDPRSLLHRVLELLEG